jgi:WD domain, G-beta repeat/Lipoprotein LpqB beta-propeller domain
MSKQGIFYFEGSLMLPRLGCAAMAVFALIAGALGEVPQEPGEAPDPLPPGAVARLGSASSPDINGVVALACSSDGKKLASLESKGTIRLWDLKTFKEIRQVSGDRGGTKAIAFSPDGKQIATLGKNDNLVLVNTQTGAQEIWPDSPTSKFLDLAFSLDGSLFAGREGTGKVRVWRTADKKPHPLYGSVGFATDFVFTPDGKHLAVEFADSPKSSRISLWNLANGTQVLEVEIPQTHATELPHMPDLKGFLCGSEVRAAKLIAITGQPLLALGGSHPGTHGLALSPDGKLLATYRWRVTDDDIHVWEAASGKERCVFPGHRAKINVLAISPDGRLLFTGSEDTTVLVWDLLSLRRVSAKSPTASELAAMWIALAGDRPADAIAALIVYPVGGLTLLKDKLPAEIRQVAGEAERLEKLIAELDDMRYAVRQKAQQELQQLGAIAKRRLEMVISGTPTLEMRRRAEQIIGRLREEQQPLPSTTVLRVLRAMEVLEHIGNADAKAMLRDVMRDAGGTIIADEAQAALRRLK